MAKRQSKNSTLAIRQFVFGAAAAGALLAGGVANAQDLPNEGGSSARSGFYLGGALGAAFDGAANNVSTTGFNAQSVANARTYFNGGNQTAGTIGIIGGYRRKLDSHPIILGLEADINYVGQVTKNQDVTFTPAAGATAPAGTYRFQQNNGANYLGSIRSHLGYTKDDWEVYISGGLALGGNSGAGGGTVTYTSPKNVVTSLTGTSSNKSKTGGVIGVGFSKDVGDSLIWRVEYMRFGFKGQTRTFTSPTSSAYTIDESGANGQFSVVRVAILKQL